MKKLNVVIVGDPFVGKNYLIRSFTPECLPTADNDVQSYQIVYLKEYTKRFEYNDEKYEITFKISVGQEGFHGYRVSFVYPDTDIFLVAFSVDTHESFKKVLGHWYNVELKPFIDNSKKKPLIFLVGCKSDLRDTSKDTSEFVGKIEAAEFASKYFRTQYVETSSKTLTGITELITTVIGTQDAEFQEMRKSYAKKYGLLPSTFPGVLPNIKIRRSVFGEQWLDALQNPQHADLVFLLEGGKCKIRAHKVMLCSASPYFQKVIYSLDKMEDSECQDKLKNRRFEGIGRVYESKDDTDKNTTNIEITDDIKARIFNHVLEYLYSGQPQLSKGVSDEDLDDLISLSQIFKLPLLEKICKNIRDHGELNDNQTLIADSNYGTGIRMRELFFNQEALSDIILKIGDEEIPSHRIVLSTRNEVFRNMLNSGYLESNSKVVDLAFGTPLEPTYALLEYLYTDHVSMVKNDPFSLIVFADQYDLSRLVELCELEIKNEIVKKCKKSIMEARIDVIDILLDAEKHNARQLLEWCLYFIRVNYEKFSEMPEFGNLAHHRDYIRENRWPPDSYFKEVYMEQEYFRNMCSVM